MPPDEATDIDTRTAVLNAAAELVASGGTGALTTRAVAMKASIQPPTLYRIFGDKRGLLAALAQDRLARFVKEKEADAPHPDPVEDLSLLPLALVGEPLALVGEREQGEARPLHSFPAHRGHRGGCLLLCLRFQ